MVSAKKYWIAAGAVLATGLTVAGVYIWRQTKKLKTYCFKFSGHKIIGVSNEITELELYLKVKNNSDLNITVSGYNFDVFLNGVFLSKIASKVPQKIAANRFSDFTLKVAFSPKETFKDLKGKWLELSKNFLLDQSNVIFTIKGIVDIKAFGFVNMDSIKIDGISSTLQEISKGSGKESCI